MSTLQYESVAIAGLVTLARLADASLYFVRFPWLGEHIVEFIFATVGFQSALVGGSTECLRASRWSRWACTSSAGAL